MLVLINEELIRFYHHHRHHHPGFSNMQIATVSVALAPNSFPYVSLLSSQFALWLIFQQNCNKKFT
jgi:hypothetical protein